MLNNVNAARLKMHKNMVVNHPNSANCQIKRKVYEGKTADPMRAKQLTTEEEPNYEIEHLGFGVMLSADPPSQPSSMYDKQDAGLYGESELRYFIEFEQEEIALKKQDLVLMEVPLTEDTSIYFSFEIVDVETMSNMPPYPKRYVLNRSQDLPIVK